MFLKMLNSSIRKRRSRIFIALFAIIIGAAVIFGLLNVYYDISLKMGQEFRSYGANIVITPGKESKTNFIEEKKLDRAVDELKMDNLMGYAPNLYGVANVLDNKLVVVGTWLDQLSKVSPYLEITGEIIKESNSSGKAYIGKVAAEKLEIEVGQSVRIKDENSKRYQQVTIQGIIQSGDVEDNQIFIDLKDSQQLFDQHGLVNVAYLSVMNQDGNLETNADRITKKYPQLEARPIKQISESETVILDKIRSLVYLVVVIILLSTLLCVATTMMTTVVERKREIGLKKALGAQNQNVMLEFLSEGAILGIIGSVIGIILGYFLAQVVGQSVFNSSITFRIFLIPIVIFVFLLVTSLACLIPVKMAVDIEPAVVLKGE